MDVLKLCKCSVALCSTPKQNLIAQHYSKFRSLILTPTWGGGSYVKKILRRIMWLYAVESRTGGSWHLDPPFPPNGKSNSEFLLFSRKGKSLRCHGLNKIYYQEDDIIVNLKWEGLVARMGECRSAIKMLTCKLIGNISLRRRKCGREHNIMRNLK